MLKIKKELLEKIKSQAEKDYPYETCGIMIGKEEDGIRVVYELLVVENANKERKNDRYEINPKDYMRAEAYADEKRIADSRYIPLSSRSSRHGFKNR